MTPKKMTPSSDFEIERMVRESHEHSLSEKVSRLKFLFAHQKEDAFPGPMLACLYYDEARLCWVSGAFVATIIVVQLAFEELFRNHYRVVCGVEGSLKSGRKVDLVGFAELVSECEQDGLLSFEEVQVFTDLRKKLRNPYVHVKDSKPSKTGNESSFITQMLKISAPELVGASVEHEAQFAIKLLTKKFPDISKRLLGMKTRGLRFANP